MPPEVPGGHTAWEFELSPEARQVFDEAVGKEKGIGYEPIAFSTQPVAGVKYSYLCRAQGTFPNAPVRVVNMHILQPLGGGSPHITQIIEIFP